MFSIGEVAHALNKETLHKELDYSNEMYMNYRESDKFIMYPRYNKIIKNIRFIIYFIL